MDEICQLGKQYSLTLQEDCNRKFGVFENKPLEEMIDHGNIHGWLQERVSQVEYKYAYCVTSLRKKDPASFDQLKSILKQKGRETGRSISGDPITMPQLYKVITDYLLDGMPCDHANSITKQEENCIIWKRNLCVHEPYWNELQGNIEDYYILRDAWLEGLAEECNAEYQRLDSNTYCIRKEVAV